MTSLPMLGKLPARRDPRDLKYENYRTAEVMLSPPPAQAHWGHGIPYGMLGNDTLGDCAEAGVAHGVQTTTYRAGDPFVPTTQETVGIYSSWFGYVPGNPSTDRGSDLNTCLNNWHNTGFAGHTIDAYLSVSPLTTVCVKESVYYYGFLYIGVQLPISAQGQEIWTVTTGPNSIPGSWGGHCIIITGYDEKYLYVVTWGRIIAMTWAWFQTYCDEAFVTLSHDWLNAQGQSPSHLAWGQLSADLSSL